MSGTTSRNAAQGVNKRSKGDRDSELNGTPSDNNSIDNECVGREARDAAREVVNVDHIDVNAHCTTSDIPQCTGHNGQCIATNVSDVTHCTDHNDHCITTDVSEVTNNAIDIPYASNNVTGNADHVNCSNEISYVANNNATGTADRMDCLDEIHLFTNDMPCTSHNHNMYNTNTLCGRGGSPGTTFKAYRAGEHGKVEVVEVHSIEHTDGESRGAADIKLLNPAQENEAIGEGKTRDPDMVAWEVGKPHKTAVGSRTMSVTDSAEFKGISAEAEFKGISAEAPHARMGSQRGGSATSDVVRAPSDALIREGPLNNMKGTAPKPRAGGAETTSPTHTETPPSGVTPLIAPWAGQRGVGGGGVDADH